MENEEYSYNDFSDGFTDGFEYVEEYEEENKIENFKKEPHKKSSIIFIIIGLILLILIIVFLVFLFKGIGKAPDLKELTCPMEFVERDGKCYKILDSIPDKICEDGVIDKKTNKCYKIDLAIRECPKDYQKKGGKCVKEYEELAGEKLGCPDDTVDIGLKDKCGEKATHLNTIAYGPCPEGTLLKYKHQGLILCYMKKRRYPQGDPRDDKCGFNPDKDYVNGNYCYYDPKPARKRTCQDKTAYVYKENCYLLKDKIKVPACPKNYKFNKEKHLCIKEEVKERLEKCEEGYTLKDHKCYKYLGDAVDFKCSGNNYKFIDNKCYEVRNKE